LLPPNTKTKASFLLILQTRRNHSNQQQLARRTQKRNFETGIPGFSENLKAAPKLSNRNLEQQTIIRFSQTRTSNTGMLYSTAENVGPNTEYAAFLFTSLRKAKEKDRTMALNQSKKESKKQKEVRGIPGKLRTE